jgi:type III secretory pathway component EscT
MRPLVAELADALAAEGVDLASLGLAWARAMPAITIVPAFGLRALPAPARAVMALAFAACILPAVAPIAPAVALVSSRPWLALALGEVLRGLPVAVAAAIPLWAATMAGGVADALRGSQDTASAPTVEGGASPLGVPLSLLAGALFLHTGGPARVVAALSFDPRASLTSQPLLALAGDLTRGISLAAALGAPLLVAAVVIEVAAALIARAASPAQVHALLAPLRALGTLTILAIVLDRLSAALGAAVQASP